MSNSIRLASLASLAFIAATTAFSSACRPPRRAACVPIPGLSPRDGAGLANAYRTHHQPLVLTADAVLLCGCYPREQGGAGESRALGGGDEARSMGGGTEARAMGGGDEARSMGGGDEARAMGGGTEARAMGSGDEARSMGGGTEARAMGGGDEARAMGGGDESRALGGASENRAHGSDVNQIQCVENRGCGGYRLTGESELRYFDGRAIADVPDRCLPMALAPTLDLGSMLARHPTPRRLF